MILLLASPLFLFPRPSLSPALLLLPLLWLFRRHSQGHFIPRTPVDWPVLGLLVMTLTSIWATPDLLFSLRKIVGLIYHVAIFYAIVNWGQLQRSLLTVALVVVSLAVVAAFLSLLGTQWIVKWSVMKRILPYLPSVIRGLPGNELGFNPNQVSGALIIFVPLQLTLLAGSVLDVNLSKVWRLGVTLGLLLSLSLTVAVVLLAQSRVAWMALALGLVGMVGIAVRQLRPFVIALVVVGVAVLLVSGPVGVTEWLVQRGWMVGSGEVSWAGRVELWTRALGTIADLPLTGTGMNMFRRVVWYLYPLYHFPYGQDIGHAHNLYLQAALDLGLPGLICYLALVGGTLAVGWRCYAKSSHRSTRLLVLGGLTGLVVHATWGMTDIVALGAKQGFLWWAVLALLVTAVVQDGREGKGSQDWPADRSTGVEAPGKHVQIGGEESGAG
ncbi:MAG: O-antigen ligase family protein [Anaerolineae bacterium]|nr:MAG: O-antigen ligase family protein [Anaerolineae bacterium]